MGLFDRILRPFRGASDAPAASSKDGAVSTNLADLKVGWMVDYDIRTWRVTDHEIYSFNDGARADSWELTDGHERMYLERSVDDGEVEWSLSTVLPIESLPAVREHILEHEDPPETVAKDGRSYRLDWSVGGAVRSASGGEERRFIEWELVDASEEHFLSIQQWSDTEFTASEGKSVEPFLFTHILRGSEL